MLFAISDAIFRRRDTRTRAAESTCGIRTRDSLNSGEIFLSSLTTFRFARRIVKTKRYYYVTSKGRYDYTTANQTRDSMIIYWSDHSTTHLNERINFRICTRVSHLDTGRRWSATHSAALCLSLSVLFRINAPRGHQLAWTTRLIAVLPVKLCCNAGQSDDSYADTCRFYDH